MEEFQAEIKNLIEDGKVEEAFKKLVREDCLKGLYKAQVFMLVGRLSLLKDDKRNEIIDEENYTTNYQLIITCLLELLAKLFGKDDWLKPQVQVVSKNTLTLSHIFRCCRYNLSLIRRQVRASKLV